MNTSEFTFGLISALGVIVSIWWNIRQDREAKRNRLYDSIIDLTFDSPDANTFEDRAFDLVKSNPQKYENHIPLFVEAYAAWRIRSWKTTLSHNPSIAAFETKLRQRVRNSKIKDSK